MLLIFWLVCSLNNNIHSYKIIYLRQGGEKGKKWKVGKERKRRRQREALRERRRGEEN